MRLSLLALLLLTTSVAAEPDNPAVAAAKKRQEAIKSIEFVGKCVEPAETPDPTAPARQPIRKPADVYFRVLVEGDRSRMEFTRRPEGALAGVRHTETRNGTVAKYMDGPPGYENWENTNGFIGPATEKRRLPDYIIIPAVLNSAPLALNEWEHWSDFERWSVDDNRYDLKGVSTELWSFNHANDWLKVRCWLDPAVGYVLRRMEIEQGRDNLTRIDIHLERHEASGFWLPSSWTVEKLAKNGTVQSKANVTVEKVTVNANWPDSEFDIAFPPGIRVTDERTPDRKEYLVLEDGSLGSFVHGPHGQSIPPPQAPQPKAPNWFVANGPLLFGVVLVIVVVVLLVLRRKASRERERPE